MDRFDLLAKKLLDEEDPLGRPARVADALRRQFNSGLYAAKMAIAENFIDDGSRAAYFRAIESRRVL